MVSNCTSVSVSYTHLFHRHLPSKPFHRKFHRKRSEVVVGGRYFRCHRAFPVPYQHTYHSHLAGDTAVFRSPCHRLSLVISCSLDTSRKDVQITHDILFPCLLYTSLVASLLFLPESVYKRLGDKRPVMGISIWTQYVLDNFATVRELSLIHISKNNDCPQRSD